MSVFRLLLNNCSGFFVVVIGPDFWLLGTSLPLAPGIETDNARLRQAHGLNILCCRIEKGSCILRVGG
jgi:hypothetical protein